MFKKLSFSAKLLAGTLFLIVVSVLIMGGTNYYSILQSVDDLGAAMVQGASEQFSRAIRMQAEITQEKVKSDLLLLDMEINRSGSLALNPAAPIACNITNQITGLQGKRLYPCPDIGGEDPQWKLRTG